MARAIHQLSPRRAGRSLPVNCAAMPETLMESELFGHEKGAFTGAVERRAGCFELAKGGTILLDEIGDMPLATQSKLLRVLEERRVRRLGSAKETDLDVRVLASTNRSLKQAIAKQAFRDDLYFRLNVFEIRSRRRCGSANPGYPAAGRGTHPDPEPEARLPRRRSSRPEVATLFLRHLRLARQCARAPQRSRARRNSLRRRHHHETASSAAKFRRQAGRCPRAESGVLRGSRGRHDYRGRRARADRTHAAPHLANKS